MSKKVMHVRPNASGEWELVSSEGTRIFGSKEQAVTEARSKTYPTKVVVRNASGQIIRQADVKTSRPRGAIREAVYASMSQKK